MNERERHKQRAISNSAGAVFALALMGNFHSPIGNGILDGLLYIALMCYLLWTTRVAIAHAIEAVRPCTGSAADSWGEK